MRALITGAGGFCGRHLTSFLASRQVEVITASCRSEANADYFIGDPTSVAQAADLIREAHPDFIFHLAGVSFSRNATDYYRINTTFATALLSSLELTGFTRTPLLLVGTSAEYGMVHPDQLPIREDASPHPYDHYGISKLAQTLMGLAASKNGLPIVMVRPFNIIGPGMPEHLVVQSFVSQIQKIIRQERPPTIRVGNLLSSRDFVDVEQVVRIYWDLLNTPSAYGKIFNLCSGKPISIRALLDTLIKIAGVKVEIQIDSERIKSIDVPSHYGSNERLMKTIGYVPKLQLESCLRKMLNFKGNR